MNNHGGKRIGAGRKPALVKKKQVLIRLSPEIIEQLPENRQAFILQAILEKLGGNYSEEMIKNAFWKTFHKSGEIFFDYLGDDEDNEYSTKCNYDEFFINLNRV